MTLTIFDFNFSEIPQIHIPKKVYDAIEIQGFTDRVKLKEITTIPINFADIIEGKEAVLCAFMLYNNTKRIIDIPFRRIKILEVAKCL